MKRPPFMTDECTKRCDLYQNGKNSFAAIHFHKNLLCQFCGSALRDSQADWMKIIQDNGRVQYFVACCDVCFNPPGPTPPAKS